LLLLLPYTLEEKPKIPIKVSSMASPMASAQEVQTILDYHFSRPQLLLDALKAAGAGFNSQHAVSARDGNKRLAQVGSVVLKTIITDDWYGSGDERGMLIHE
jgi:ribonuclease-3